MAAYLTCEEPVSPCLPRGSVVFISGNNRTKHSLLGQRAVVRKAVGLGGWHHVTLADGSEVKLQRNALTVLEYGPAEDTDSPSHGSSSADTEAREPQIDILIQPRIRRAPKQTVLTDLPLFKKVAACSGGGLRTSACPLVNLHKLDTVSLKRYRRVFQLAEVDAAAHKDALLTAVQEHFTTQEVEEATVLVEFVSTLQRRYRRQQLMVRQCPGYAGLHEQDQQQQRPSGLLSFHFAGRHHHHQQQPQLCLFK